MKDTEESENITISKKLIIDTNNKKIDFTLEDKINIEEGAFVNIRGGGEFVSSKITSLINLRGSLITDDVTIKTEGKGKTGGTICIDEVTGEFVSNNCNISSITSFKGKKVVLNGGNYGVIMNLIFENPLIINSGNIEEVSMIWGGNVEINGGTIDLITMADNDVNIKLTIGDMNKGVDNTNPEIRKIEDQSDLFLIGVDTTINFYSGIIKESFYDFVNGDPYEDYSRVEYKIREGYKATNTAEGTILVKK